ncbi:response regulator [Pantoea sp. PNT02]|jgi:two-component system secretion response regulator SsrB|uniref:LuxR C-terminal-related transcriptional regulator n=1 Tax=Pantoea sp. PNT02 TaxID=2769261 RepID=UPI0017831AB4|nr:LuxR C-terminal-related transcriptional regulator [Pantoea sp. PNT02]MBD9646338.1 response regulator [Pantoea sp. PNT02]
MRQYVAQKFSSPEDIPAQKIVIVDHASITPYAVAKLIAKHPMMKVVGHEGEGSAALALCRKLMPDIVIIDPLLTGLDGVSIIKQIRRINPEVRILVYSLENRQISLTDYIELEVNAIVLKNSPLETLVKAINQLSIGKEFLDDALSASTPPINPQSVFQDVSITLPHLSPREKQVLKMIVEGGKNKEIARILSISVKTIESHRLNLMRKLNAHSVLDLIRWAQRMNISH